MTPEQVKLFNEFLKAADKDKWAQEHEKFITELKKAEEAMNERLNNQAVRE